MKAAAAPPSNSSSSPWRRPRSAFSFYKKVCPFTGPSALRIDYKDTRVLERFTTERGKIIPARISGVSHAKQRLLAREIKKARILGLLPYVKY